MKIILATLLIALQTANEMRIVSPSYPPNAVRGGNVVAMLHFSKGAVREITVLSGDEPFTAPARAALAQWRLQGRETKTVLVLFNFRDPYLVMSGSERGITLSSRSAKIRGVKSGTGVPVPTEILDPFYLGATLTVQGASVLRFRVNESGTADRIEVIQELGDCTQATVEALKKASFLPALDSRGKPIASEAFAVFVYRPLNTDNSSGPSTQP